MCLIVKQKFWSKKPKIAKNDIICYKILNAKLTSIAYGFQYDLGIIYKNKESLSDKTAHVYEAFHSYKTQNIACESVRKAHGDFFIVKCIIPKGTKYYKGYHNHDNLKGYASEQILIKEIVSCYPLNYKYVYCFYENNREYVVFSRYVTPYYGNEYFYMEDYIEYLNKKVKDITCVSLYKI